MSTDYIHTIPFYSQSWNLDGWRELGFTSRDEAEYWQWSSCGALCLKMALDANPAANSKNVSIAEFIYDGLKVGAYTHATGWNHKGLVRLAHAFNTTAKQREPLRIEDIVLALQKDQIPLISIKWGFEATKTLREKIFFWKKFGGHMALVTGYRMNERRELDGLYVHHTSVKKENNWLDRFIPLERFTQGFVGRGILVKLQS